MLAQRQVQARRQRLHGDAEGGRAVQGGGWMPPRKCARLNIVDSRGLTPLFIRRNQAAWFGPAPVVQPRLGREGDAVLRAGLQACSSAGIAQHAMDLAPTMASVGQARKQRVQPVHSAASMRASMGGEHWRPAARRAVRPSASGPAGRAAGGALDQGVGRRTATRIAALPALAAGQQRLDFLDQRVLCETAR